jgi:hypothetical protein
MRHRAGARVAIESVTMRRTTTIVVIEAKAAIRRELFGCAIQVNAQQRK